MGVGEKDREMPWVKKKKEPEVCERERRRVWVCLRRGEEKGLGLNNGANEVRDKSFGSS